MSAGLIDGELRISSQALTFQNIFAQIKIFAKLKFSTVIFEKIPSFVCLGYKSENKWILKVQILFS